MATVYSYIRFSSKKQEQGDSLRRQTKLGNDWLAQHPEHTLDSSLSLQDLGVSAFRGANLDEKGALGAFIALAKRPDSPIAKGSILLIERLDRFSRQQTRKAYRAFVELVEAGIAVQTLDPAQTITEENVDDLHVVLPLILQMTMAHEQSREKSRRVGSVWEAKRQQARQGRPMFGRCPAWLTWDAANSTFVAKAEAIQAIEYAFRRTVEGCGQRQLVAELNEAFSPLGRSGRWNSSYVQKILSDRSVLGELQPHKFDSSGNRVPSGAVIPDYYPRIIGDDVFLAAAGSKSLRKKAKGPNSKFVNLFVGLLVGGDGHSLQIQTGRAKRKSCPTYVQRRLTSYGHLRGLPEACPITVRYDAIEACLLRMLYELDEGTLAPDAPADQRLPAAEARVDAIRRRIAELRNALTDTSPKAAPPKEIYEAITHLGSQLIDADRELEEARLGVGVDSIAALRKSRDLIVAMSQQSREDQHATRLRLRGVIAALVKCARVDLRRQGRRVRFSVTLELKSGERRFLVDGQSAAQSPGPMEGGAVFEVASVRQTDSNVVSVKIDAGSRSVKSSPSSSLAIPLPNGGSDDMDKAFRAVRAKIDRRVARR